MPVRTEIVCEQCGARKLVKPCYVRRAYRMRFCSKACAYQGRRNTGFSGKSHSPEARARIRAGHLGKKKPPASAETRAKISAAAIARARAAGKPEWTPEYRRAYNRQKNREHKRRLLLTDIGRLENILRSTLRHALRRVTNGTAPRGTFRHLDYGPKELLAHVQARLAACNHACPMCGVLLADGFDLDHITPLSSACTVFDVVRLFALENLDVLCARCNRWVKRDRMPENHRTGVAV